MREPNTTALQLHKRGNSYCRKLKASNHFVPCRPFSLSFHKHIYPSPSVNVISKQFFFCSILSPAVQHHLRCRYLNRHHPYTCSAGLCLLKLQSITSINSFVWGYNFKRMTNAIFCHPLCFLCMSPFPKWSFLSDSSPWRNLPSRCG